MKWSRSSGEKIVYAIRRAESGTTGGDVYRQHGIAEQTFHAWKKKYEHLGVSKLRRLRLVDEKNARLKGLAANLSLDKLMQSEALRNKV